MALIAIAYNKKHNNNNTLYTYKIYFYLKKSNPKDNTFLCCEKSINIVLI